MTTYDSPTLDDLISRFCVLRDEAAGRVRELTTAITADHAAKGRLGSGATLVALASLIEQQFDDAYTEMLQALARVKAVPEIEYKACRDQTLLHARDLIPILRGAADIEKWAEMIGTGSAAQIVDGRIEKLFEKIDYRLRQFEIGLDKVTHDVRFVEPLPFAEEPAPIKELSTTSRASRPFQVALSFASEQREYVREVANALAARHIAVFYDEFEANALWGKDGAEHFHRVFAHDAQYVVMFISTEYVAKSWTRHERQSAISEQMKADVEYILPVRFDSSNVPGLPDTLQFLEAAQYTPAQLAVEIATKVGVSSLIGKASDVPPPASGSMFGQVTFDYGAFDGRYVIGHDATAFDTAWSKGSDASIHLYNDPATINGVAIARGASDIGQITDASSYDFTSRSRTVRTGEIAVLRNNNGFYAAVQVIQIDDDSRGAASDSLTLRYLICADGKTDFTPTPVETKRQAES